MANLSIAATLLTIIGLAACAKINFGSDGLVYYDPAPHFFVSTGADCVTTATVVALPGKRRSLQFEPGFGTADLSASLSNGLISNVGQKTDTKIPETITAVAALAPKLGIMKEEKGEEKAAKCEPTARLYRIEIDNEKVKLGDVIEFPVKEKVTKAPSGVTR